jgi:hypothetical protein
MRFLQRGEKHQMMLSAERGKASNDAREAIRKKNKQIASTRVEVPRETYETIIIDPPWPMTKIERDVRPNQEGFDYPTMNESLMRGRWKLGRALAKWERAKPRPGKTASTGLTQLLERLGTSKVTAMEAQRIGTLPEKDLRKALDEARDFGRRLPLAHGWSSGKSRAATASKASRV